MKAKNIFIILILAAVLYILYKRGVFSSLRGKASDSDASLDSSAASLMGDIPSDALYADYKPELERYVARLNVNEAWGLVKGTYLTESSFRDQLKSWVKLIWLSAKNNSKWTQENVRIQAAENGITYNQQIVKHACWEMGQAEKSKISLTGLSGQERRRAESTRQSIENAFNRLLQSVDNL